MKKEEIKELAKNGRKYAKATRHAGSSSKSKALKMKTGFGKTSDGEIKCKDCGKMNCSCK